jgi:hypothetical protein
MGISDDYKRYVKSQGGSTNEDRSKEKQESIARQAQLSKELRKDERSYESGAIFLEGLRRSSNSVEGEAFHLIRKRLEIIYRATAPGAQEEGREVRLFN